MNSDRSFLCLRLAQCGVADETILWVWFDLLLGIGSLGVRRYTLKLCQLSWERFATVLLRPINPLEQLRLVGSMGSSAYSESIVMLPFVIVRVWVNRRLGFCCASVSDL